MALHPAMVAAFFLENDDSADLCSARDPLHLSYHFLLPRGLCCCILDSLCNKVTVKQDPTCAQGFVRGAAAPHSNAMELEKHAGLLL